MLKRWKPSCFKGLGQKGQFSYFIYFIVVMVILMPVLFIGFPTLQTIAIGFLGASDGFINTNYDLLPEIDDPNLRSDINDMIVAQTDSQETRINILNDAIVYGVIFGVVIVFIGLYLLGRRNIEVGSMG